MTKKPASKRTRKARVKAVAASARAKAMTVKARQRLIDTLLDGAVADTPEGHIVQISEHIVRRGVGLIRDRLEVDPSSVIVIHPAHQTTRLLNAISEHIEATNEDGELVVDRLISMLGSSAALATLRN